MKRRKSLPRPLSPVGPAVEYRKAYSHSTEAVVLTHKYGHSLDSNMERGADGVLLPSLSRTGRSRSVRPKNASVSSLVVAREDSTSSARGRRMFIVGDADGSDAENDRQGRNADVEAGSAEGPKEETPMDEPEQQFDVSEREKEARKRTRRYHALLELITTEVGYLLDLRALVSVCVS